MSSRKTLFTAALSLGATLTLSACASMPEPSSPMRLGQAAAAPTAYLDFCRRQPEDCGGAPAPVIQKVAEMELERRQAALTRLIDGGAKVEVRATAAVEPAALNWAHTFSEARRRREAMQIADRVAPDAPDVAPPAAVHDWSAVFAARLRPVLDQQGRPERLSIAQPAPQPAPTILAAQPAAPLPTMDPKLWAKLNRVNDAVNRAIVRATDQAAYGEVDLWITPLAAGTRFGDCEDYVLEKRRALLEAGLPAAALSIAVVMTSWGETHAVLLVATDQGEYVLDNLQPRILPWRKADLRWRERQVAGAPFNWAMARPPLSFAAKGALLPAGGL